MDCTDWMQKSVHQRHCELSHTLSHSEDMRLCKPARVHSGTTDTPKENLSVSLKPGRERRYPSHPQWCETPKLTKKEICLRRRLLGAKSMTDVKMSVSRKPSCGDTYTPGVSESPDVLLGGPLSYSTLRSEVATESCMKRRLVFSQAVTSTLKDGRGGTSPSLSDPDLDETIISGLLLSDTPEAAQGPDCFRTPVSRLAVDLSESLNVLSTPSHTPLLGLDISEDSGFGSLRLDVSEQGGDDSSFQEGAQRAALSRDHRRSRLEHQRRLSTLREGSQSDDEVKGHRVKGRGLLLNEEVFVKTPPPVATRKDLSITPALQAMEALSRSFTLLHELDQPISTCLNLSHNLHQPIATFLPLSRLIGRKMGLGRMDVLTELHVAKTLFSDECLRPCPRCERPARCHSVKAEGVCSWSECVYHFCTSCLRAYHGSAECTRLSNVHSCRKGRSQLLPGSAQSKRNIKRL
ncbi:F-box only protein 43 [Bagarius yarrelli]|uniref:F-box only protein 43 n=1 Tax=Bagarius yarrelli TaxID=175774 RepID=A0A556TUP3_BAGYA|nr:F-box only protein 43 [Bagarius yarrelli]